MRPVCRKAAGGTGLQLTDGGEHLRQLTIAYDNWQLAARLKVDPSKVGNNHLTSAQAEHSSSLNPDSVYISYSEIAKPSKKSLWDHVYGT